jgi:hypothetical protein
VDAGCRGDAAISHTAAYGPQTVSPLGTTNTTCTLHATEGGGSVSQAVTVTTAAKPAKPIGE